MDSAVITASKGLSVTAGSNMLSSIIVSSVSGDAVSKAPKKLGMENGGVVVVVDVVVVEVVEAVVIGISEKNSTYKL